MASDETVGFYEILEKAAIEAIELGDGLDNPLGALLCMACGIQGETLLRLTAGGTVNICAGRQATIVIHGRK